MLDAIAGLKIEGNTVLSLNQQTQDWECAPTALIPQLEELFRRLESFDYPETTVRENIIFEKEHDIGTASVKSFKDEDGDLTVTYQCLSKPDIEINEDAAFGIEPQGARRDSQECVSHWELNPERVSPTRMPDGNPSDSPLMRPIKDAAITEALEDLRVFEAEAKRKKHLYEGISNESTPAKASKRTARKSVSFQDAAKFGCCFQKRPIRNNRTSLDVFIEQMKRIFLEAGYSRGGPQKKGENRDRVSFISKKYHLKNPSGDSSLFINMLKSNRKNEIRDTLEENFYLERVDGESSFDEEIESAPRL